MVFPKTPTRSCPNSLSLSMKLFELIFFSFYFSILWFVVFVFFSEFIGVGYLGRFLDGEGFESEAFGVESSRQTSW